MSFHVEWDRLALQAYDQIPKEDRQPVAEAVIEYLRGDPGLQAGEESDPCGAGQGQAIRRKADRRLEQMSGSYLTMR